MKNGLTPRQCALKRWLEENHKAGMFFTIETVCACVTMPDGTLAYKFNTDPRNHDKCVALSSDVRAINWNVNQGYKIIVKDSYGGIKLCESKEELDNWREKELKAITRKYQYLNNLVWKAERDGTIPLINQANNPVVDFKAVEVFEKKGEENGEY